MQTNLYFLPAMAIFYIVLLGSFPQDESVIGLLNLSRTCWTNWHNVSTTDLEPLRIKDTLNQITYPGIFIFSLNFKLTKNNLGDIVFA